MLRGMVFLDYFNFEFSLRTYYNSMGQKSPSLDYKKLFPKVVKLIPDVDYLKTFMFFPKPDDFLIKDEKIAKNYKWLTGLSSSKYIDVIEGRYIARPTNNNVPMNIENRDTYYKIEKSTDINLAIHALGKAHFNSYDVAFIISGDSDYISLYRQLKNIGKIVVVIAVKGQQLKSITKEVDDYKFLDNGFFEECLRGKSNN